MDKLTDDVCKLVNKLNDQLTNLSEVYNVSACRKWQRRSLSQLPEVLLPKTDLAWLENSNISDYKLSELQFMIAENAEEFSQFSYNMYEKLLKILNNMSVYLDKIKEDNMVKESNFIL